MKIKCYKYSLSDEPSMVFEAKTTDEMIDRLAKEEMQHIMFYATNAFRKGTDILARGCYLFHHNPKAFEKYATSPTDFAEDIHHSSYL